MGKPEPWPRSEPAANDGSKHKREPRMSRVRVLVGTRKGAFTPQVGRQARSAGGRWAPFRRMGDLPPEGVARGSKPALRVGERRRPLGRSHCPGPSGRAVGRGADAPRDPGRPPGAPAGPGRAQAARLPEIKGQATPRAVLGAIEASYPVLCGTIRDRATRKRRAFVRFFACGRDVFHEPEDALLPDAVASGREPFLIIGRHCRRLTGAR
jgi:sulfur-carrier protein